VVRETVPLRSLQEAAKVGEVIDQWRGVPVRANGLPYDQSHGRHVAADGYYYGRQWQCVEFIKRFHYDHLHHAMPDGMGHAREFFDPAVAHGQLNAKRGLRQFTNGGDEAPRLDDLMVWTFGTYGHVAIVSKVGGDFIEVVQQNVLQGSRERLKLVRDGDGWRVTGRREPAGWLRMP
jgi:surface antigen